MRSMPAIMPREWAGAYCCYRGNTAVLFSCAFDVMSTVTVKFTAQKQSSLWSASKQKTILVTITGVRQHATSQCYGFLWFRIGLSYSHIPQSDIRQTDDPVFPESISLRLGAAIVSSQLVIIIVNVHNKPDRRILYFPRVFIWWRIKHSSSSIKTDIQRCSL